MKTIAEIEPGNEDRSNLQKVHFFEFEFELNLQCEQLITVLY